MSQYNSTTTPLVNQNKSVLEPAIYAVDTVSTDFFRADRDDGTESGSREWAKEFYLRNSTFLRQTIQTTDELRYFFGVWASSTAATDLVNLVGHRQAGQVIHALVVDGRVFHTKHRTLLGNRSVIWNSLNPDSPKCDSQQFTDLDIETLASVDDLENYSRNLAKKFYTDNIGFLRGAIRTQQSLSYFYKVWSTSKKLDDMPWNRHDSTAHPIRDFSYSEFKQVLGALCNDGQVCRVIKRPGKTSSILWENFRSLNRKCPTVK